MILSNLAYRYLLAERYCRWASDRGGRDAAGAESEQIVREDPDNDLDFVVMSVLHGQLQDLTTRSMVRGLGRLGIDVPSAEAQDLARQDDGVEQVPST